MKYNEDYDGPVFTTGDLIADKPIPNGMYK